MRILVFGASGRCGSWVVRQGLERGHNVTAVFRPTSSYTPPDGTAAKVGDVSDADFVRSATEGHDTVLSCVGLTRAGMLPWSSLLSPPDFVTRFTEHLLDAVSDQTIRRIIWISAGGVGDSRDQATAPIRALISAGHVGTAYTDLERAEALIPAEDERWLAVRPVTLMNGQPTGLAGAVRRYGLFSVIRRSDVAAWMLDVADETRSFSERTVLLGT